MLDKDKAVVLLSGGLDSAVLLYLMKSRGARVLALSLNYGPRHLLELRQARAVADMAQTPLTELDISSIASLLQGSSPTQKDIPVPLGHYAGKTMRATVVPNRNMILLAVAIGHAISQKAAWVGYAGHAGDHAVYPDCRPEFFEKLSTVAEVCHYEPVRLLAPFMRNTKADIVTIGRRLGVPFHITRSCHQAEEGHCGRCGTCVERREAFSIAGVADPTDYLAELEEG